MPIPSTSSGTGLPLPRSFVEPERIHHSGGRLGTAYGKITSSAKAERHYRKERLRFLRMLGHATYRNGSHFAILWVSPTAQSADVFASEALQPKLDEWLGPKVRKQAQACVRQLQTRRNSSEAGKKAANTGAENDLGRSEIFRENGDVMDPYLDDESAQNDESDGEAVRGTEAEEPEQQQEWQPPPVSSERQRSSPQLTSSENLPDHRTRAPPVMPAAETTPSAETATMDEAAHARSTLPVQPSSALADPKDSVSCQGGDAVMETEQSGRDTPVEIAREATLPTSRLPAVSTSPAPPHVMSTPRIDSLETLDADSVSQAPEGGDEPPSTALVDYDFTNDELELWFTHRFNELEFKMEKLVCRTWIKAIAPGKHKKFPYQNGEASKPEWWPAVLRHKEPDHLTKPERLQLLVHLIRRGPGSIPALQASTAANSAWISASKMRILELVYDAADQERKLLLQSQGACLESMPLRVAPETLACLGEAVKRTKRQRDSPPAPAGNRSSGRKRRRRLVADSADVDRSEAEEDSNAIASVATNSTSSSAAPTATSPTNADEGGSAADISMSTTGEGASAEADETPTTVASGRPKRKSMAPTRFAASAHSAGARRGRKAKAVADASAQVSANAAEIASDHEEVVHIESRAESPVADTEVRLRFSIDSTSSSHVGEVENGLRSPPPTATGTRSRELKRPARAPRKGSSRPRTDEIRNDREETGLRSPPPTANSGRRSDPSQADRQFHRARTSSPVLEENEQAVVQVMPAARPAGLIALGIDFGPLVAGASHTDASSSGERPLPRPARRDYSNGYGHVESAPFADGSSRACPTTEPPLQPFAFAPTTTRHELGSSSHETFSHDVHSYPAPTDGTMSYGLSGSPFVDTSLTSAPRAPPTSARQLAQSLAARRDAYLMTPPGSGGDPYSLIPRKTSSLASSGGGSSSEDWAASFARQLDAAIHAVGAVEDIAPYTPSSLPTTSVEHVPSLAASTDSCAAPPLILEDGYYGEDDLHSENLHTSFYAPQLSAMCGDAADAAMTTTNTTEQYYDADHAYDPDAAYR
ncbi:hypothetical protein JCM10908_001838 [Rhodotorula pacifica]|uniref:uncharacterized protein n=1 Tax=Rhodotorula pacifica TaxID=1495444 RepID=UPI003177DC70